MEFLKNTHQMKKRWQKKIKKEEPVIQTKKKETSATNETFNITCL